MPRYAWPASAINADDMAVLFQVREGGACRVPISRLIARAVRETYGRQPAPKLVVLPSQPQPNPEPLKEAA
jgi:hypothetical protein